MLAVGIEGVWGVALCVVAMPLLRLIKDKDGMPLDDGVAALNEIAANQQLCIAVRIRQPTCMLLRVVVRVAVRTKTPAWVELRIAVRTRRPTCVVLRVVLR